MSFHFFVSNEKFHLILCQFKFADLMNSAILKVINSSNSRGLDILAMKK